MVTLTDRVARHRDVVRRPAVRCAPDASARRCRRSACPTAAAMCVGPVSPDTISAAPRASATRSAIVVCGDSIAAPPAAPTTSLRERLFAGPPQHDRLQAVPLAQTRRHGGETRGRPPLVRPRGAGIEQRVASARLLAQSRRTAGESTRSIGNSGGAARHAELLEHAEIDLDDVTRLARIVHTAAAGIVRPRCRTGRASALARVARREADHARRAGTLARRAPT